MLADAMVLGRKTYEGLAAVWPQLTEDPTLGRYADRINSMPKYVASRSLRGPLEWNATLLEGDLADSVRALKAKHERNLIVSGCGELAHALTNQGLVDEFWFWVSPWLWASGPRIFDGVGPVRLHWPLPRRIPRGCCGCATGQPPISRALPPAPSDAARSLIWNEAQSRATVFLTVLSASPPTRAWSRSTPRSSSWCWP